MNSSNVLLLPGWQNSGPRHWQSLWEREHGYTRVDQHDWMRPLRGDWIARLEDAGKAGLDGQAVLVAPGDAEREEMRPVLPSWSPIPMQRLPFSSVLLGSQSDPYCTFERARTLASAWGSSFVDCGRVGHINADSGLDLWPQGHAMLQQLQQNP